MRRPRSERVPSPPPDAAVDPQGWLRLTAGERRVLELLASGLAPKQAALEQGVSISTVRSHIASAKRKTGARTLPQLVWAFAGSPVGDAGVVGTGHLTTRQLQVVALLAEGHRHRDIAARLSISERQVQRHIRNAVGRLGIASTEELVASAVSEGMVSLQKSSRSPSHADT
jgi:DNA-binding CsgD family transcriptional regulator